MDIIHVEVAYARPEKQSLIEVQIERGSTARSAIEASGVLNEFPELELDALTIGIFANPVSLEQVLAEGDRIEIYRPLAKDPKEARRQRAKKGA